MQPVIVTICKNKNVDISDAGNGNTQSVWLQAKAWHWHVYFLLRLCRIMQGRRSFFSILRCV